MAAPPTRHWLLPNNDPHLFPLRNYVCLKCWPTYRRPAYWRLIKFPDEVYKYVGKFSLRRSGIVDPWEVYHYYHPLKQRDLYFTVDKALCNECYLAEVARCVESESDEDIVSEDDVDDISSDVV
jgi:hypothetical protein